MKLTIYKASSEFGVDRKSLARWLSEAGHDVEKRKEFTLREIHKAIAGDLRTERTREARERANLLELDRKEKSRELFPWNELEPWMDKRFTAIRQRILAMPAQLGAKCNPTDPAFAQAQCDQWVKEFLPLLRNDIKAIR